MKMKLIVPVSVLLLLTSTLSAHAEDQYLCLNSDGQAAELTVRSDSEIVWNEPWHSASSAGHFMGRETAPFSESKDYFLFRLTDFHATEDSSYILALQSLHGQSLEAVVYFDNDDHPEYEIWFHCLRRN
ncbi:MAG: hypothetical protein AB7G93_01325 [Bdellovibrionales bacterium]